MAILSRIEFAELCGVLPAYINTYIKRGKINTLRLDKGKIDTEDQLNIYFRKNLKKNQQGNVEERRELKREKKRIEQEKSQPVTPPPAATPLPDPSQVIEELYENVVEKLKIDTYKPISPVEPKRKSKPKYNEDDYDDDESLDWDLRKKKAEALLKEKQAEKEYLTVEKLMGKLMPTDMVQQIIQVNVNHIYKTLESEFMNLASIYCDILANGDRAKMGEIVARLRTATEKIVKDTEKTALKEVENVIDEYAETRSRGERK